MNQLLEGTLRKVATLPEEKQDAIASQVLETSEDEAACREKLARNPGRLRALAKDALGEHHRGETRPLNEIL
jgi:hypothetical protein